MRRVRVITNDEHPTGRVETETGDLVKGVEAVHVNLRVGEPPRINLSFTGLMVDSDVLGILDEPQAVQVREALRQHWQHQTLRTIEDLERNVAAVKLKGETAKGAQLVLDAVREVFRLQGMIA